jgi:hypothetical protein
MKALGLVGSHRVTLMLCAVGLLTALGCGDDTDDTSSLQTQPETDVQVANDSALLGEDGSVQVQDAQLAVLDSGTNAVDAGAASGDAQLPEADAMAAVTDVAVRLVDAIVEAVDMGGDGQDAMLMEVDAETVPINEMRFGGCRLADEWSIDIHSVPPLGQGCQTGGGVALGDQTHVFRVIASGGALLTLELLSPSTSPEYSVIVAQLVEENDQCKLSAHMENGFYFPNDQMADGLTTQVVLRFDYDVIVDSNGIITGTGFSTDRYQAFPDENNLDQSAAAVIRTCTEPLVLTGQINAN